MKGRLAIICTHPIQYYAPVFKLLTANRKVMVRVFYTWGIQSINKYDPGFGKIINWDIPLLEGYDYVFVNNTSNDPGSHHFNGIINPTLYDEVNSWCPDAVMIYGWNYNSHFELMRKLKNKIKLWFRGDSNLLDPIPGWRYVLKKIALTYVYRCIDLAFYVGTQNRLYYKAFGVKEEQLVFAPHAIDNERFYDSVGRNYEEQASLWRESLGFKSKDIVILFSGKFEQKKNPLLLLKALKSFNAKNTTQLKLLLVGNGLLENELKAFAQTMEGVVFLDFQNQSKMPIVYRLGNLFCLPSSGPGETWGLAVNEALASGIPVIVSNRVGCAVDLVNPQKTGYIFEHDNFDHFQQVLQIMVEKIEKGLLKGKPEKFIANWSFEQQVKVFEDFLN